MINVPDGAVRPKAWPVEARAVALLAAAPGSYALGLAAYAGTLRLASGRTAGDDLIAVGVCPGLCFVAFVFPAWTAILVGVADVARRHMWGDARRIVTFAGVLLATALVPGVLLPAAFGSGPVFWSASGSVLFAIAFAVMSVAFAGAWHLLFGAGKYDGGSASESEISDLESEISDLGSEISDLGSEISDLRPKVAEVMLPSPDCLSRSPGPPSREPAPRPPGRSSASDPPGTLPAAAPPRPARGRRRSGAAGP